MARRLRARQSVRLRQRSNHYGGHKELDRVMGERIRKKAELAAKFLQKKPIASSKKTEPSQKK